MGNSCVCFNRQNKWETPEIFTALKENIEPSRSLYMNDTYCSNYNEQAEKEIVEKSKVAATTSYNNNNHFLEEIKSFDTNLVESAFNHDIKVNDPFPIRDNYMDFAMDLFDEINKFRTNPQLFVGLIEKYPSKFFE
jgi:hypothetical protein